MWIDEGTAYSNFVASLDGIVAVVGRPPSFISLGAESDRVMMGSLRAFADAVIIGAGTLRAEPDHRWDPGFIAPSRSDDFARLRIELGLDPSPRLIVVTISGELPDSSALEGALIVASKTTADEIARKQKGAEVMAAPSTDRVDMKWLIGALRERGYSRILVEGGPRLMGQIVQEGCLDELFITISPVLVGKVGEKSTMLEKVDLSEDPPNLKLLELRNDGSHVFMRYKIV